MASTAIASEIQLAQSTPDRTQLMQQSHHQQRVDREKQERAERQAVAEVNAALQGGLSDRQWQDHYALRGNDRA